MQSLDLTEGRAGAAPLWLLQDGTLGTSADSAPSGIVAQDVLVTAARWVSSRRTSTFAELFPPRPFEPERPVRHVGLTATQAGGLLRQLRGALEAAAVGGVEARRDPVAAGQVRSAALTVLSHLVATGAADQDLRGMASEAAGEIFRLIDDEHGETAQPALRGHAIVLLQLRGAALSPEHRARATSLLHTLTREAPPYADIPGPWRFAMCSDHAFHEGEREVLVNTHGFRRVELPPGAPVGPSGYSAFEAPFRTPTGEPVLILARTASPWDENHEMGEPYFTGLLINRHAQLGSYDLRASSVKVQQRGYKLMMNSQCAGLTTRFAITRLFPDADVYSSWDSTFFRTDGGGGTGKVIASEGLDCFVAILQGMSRKESFAAIDMRIRAAQWSHPQSWAVRDYVQFVGPAHPLVAARFSDVERDGRADVYDGFLDFFLRDIAEDLEQSMTPRAPGVAASQISGEAATGLNWATGSMNRVTQYSDLWADLPGRSEICYAFQSGGFYSHLEPPEDIRPGKLQEDPGKLPCVCRYVDSSDPGLTFRVEVMFHAYLSHSGKELKRLLVAADALARALDLGHLPAKGRLAEPLGQRAMLLLTLAGLLDYPADQNFLDGLWAMALRALRLPEISRSLVRGCITSEDHDASSYYGSKRGIGQLIEALKKSDSLAYARLCDPDPTIGRAAELDVG